MRRSLLSAAALAAGAVGGAVLGFVAERAVVDPLAEPEPDDDDAGVTTDVTAPDGTRLTVRTSGPADADCILLVHGLSLSNEIWAAQRAGLQRRYRVLTLDMRGHGASDEAAGGDYSAEALGSDVAAALDTLEAHRCVVVGHSMGGMAVLAALAARPDLLVDRVAGVCLVNTAAASIIPGLRFGSVAAGVAFVRERALSTRLGRAIYGGVDEAGLPLGNDLATVVTRVLGVGVDAPEQAVRKVRRLILDSRPHVAGELWRTVGTVDLIAAARAVRVPALVIAGVKDRVLPAHHSRRLVEALPDAQLVELDDVGHVCMLERPDDVTALLDTFAGRVLGAASGYGERQHSTDR